MNKSVEEFKKTMIENRNLWDKFILNPKMNWLRWLIYNLPDVPKDIYNNIKWFIQRGKKILDNVYISKEEYKRYKNGWKIFQKYYFDLWD